MKSDISNLKNLRDGFLQDFSEKELELLLSLAKNIDLLPNDILVHEGDSGKSFYILLTGELEVLKKDNRQKNNRIAYLKNANCIGEMALIDNKLRSATIKAITNSALLEFQNDEVKKHNQLYTKLVVRIARDLAQKLRETNMHTTREMGRNTFLESVVNIDGLTETYTRRFMFDFLSQLTKLAKRDNGFFSVLLIDIDYFKKINDQYGHTIGDKVLKEFANTCKKSLRENNCLCRYGGEEFLAVLPECDLDNAKMVGDRLQQVIKNISIPYKKEVIHVTASIGVASYNKKDDSINSLINRADQALYIAKRNGRNLVITENEFRLQ